jgi:HlyD family secretion protein
MAALRLVQSRVSADLQLSRGQLGQAVDPRRLSPNQLNKLRALRDEYASRIDAARQGVVQAQAAFAEVRINLQAKSQALRIREAMLRDIAPLAREGALARTQYQKELQEVVLLRGEVAALRSNQARARAALAEARQRMANTEALTRIDFSTKVEESEKQLAELSNQITETGLTLKYQKIISPVKGIVFDLKAGTPGYVVNTEAPIVKIVPTDRLVARIFLTNKDIGFVRPGQAVKVRIDAFPYNEFGEISGRVASIGSDVLAPDETYNYFRFPVTVDLDRSYLLYKGRKLELGSGMSLSANVILRQRPVISIFTQQLLPFWDTLEKL